MDMRYNKEKTVIFTKRPDDTYVYLSNALLNRVEGAVLPTGRKSGHCTVCIESTQKSVVDFLYKEHPDLMIRAVDYGRYSDPKGGELLCRLSLENGFKIDYNGDNESGYYWSFTAMAKVIEWGTTI